MTRPTMDLISLVNNPYYHLVTRGVQHNYLSGKVENGNCACTGGLLVCPTP